MIFSSKDLKEFLDKIEASKTDYNIAKDVVSTEEKRTQDLLHAIEFEPSAKERNKFCTKLKRARIERRASKDVIEELEPLMKFLEVPANVTTLNNMKRLLGEMRKVEQYHANRTYHPKLKEGE